jgi:hypothetical protein
MTPTLRPRGNVRSTQGTCNRLEIATGTGSASAKACWYRTKKPQELLIPMAP